MDGGTGDSAVTYRNRRLLDISHEAPCFLLLGVPGCGTNPSVAVHSDMLRHGRGAGHKSSDALAVAGCPACHAAFTRENLGRDGYEWAWMQAHERYTVWLWENERIKVA